MYNSVGKKKVYYSVGQSDKTELRKYQHSGHRDSKRLKKEGSNDKKHKTNQQTKIMDKDKGTHKKLMKFSIGKCKNTDGKEKTPRLNEKHTNLLLKDLYLSEIEINLDYTKENIDINVLENVDMPRDQEAISRETDVGTIHTHIEDSQNNTCDDKEKNKEMI